MSDALGRRRIGFIGFGSRGLSVFERVASLAAGHPRLPIEIVIFEPREPGCGVHATDQPDHLLLNTIASQLGMYPDALALAHCPAAEEREGPSFLGWCHARGILVDEDGIPSADGRPVDGGDFLPRRFLGLYLREVFEEICRSLPGNVSVTLCRELATEVRSGPWRGSDQQRGYHVTSQSGYQTVVDCLILSTGHGSPDTVDSQRALETVAPQQEVLIEGLGLCAMDCLASLSRGRGGRFVPTDEGGALRYIPSGLEPAILMQTRSGLPFRSRPMAHPGRMRHRALVLTPERLSHLRALSPDGKLDFDTDILPLMLIEMRGAAIAVATAPGRPEAGHDLLGELAGIGAPLLSGVQDLAAALDRLEEEHGALDLSSVQMPKIPSAIDGEAYESWFAAWIADDIAKSLQGACASPAKAAIEVWRDLRDMLRAAVDFGSLRHESHLRFYRYWIGAINRLVAGPQKERHADLLALLDAGVVRMVHPAKNVPAHVARLPARIAATGLCSTTSGPAADLHALGRLRAVIATPGLDAIEVGPDLRAVNRDGKVMKDIFVLGPATEGSSYYNHYVPSSGAPSRFMADAHRVAAACLEVERSTVREAS